MARHNREGRGEDQHGFEYRISYQPDWLRLVKVSRDLPSGRRSTMTLFRNPQERREADPGDQVRTRITCLEQGVDVEIVVRSSDHMVSRVVVSCQLPETGSRGGSPPGAESERISFVLEQGLAAPLD